MHAGAGDHDLPPSGRARRDVTKPAALVACNGRDVSGKQNPPNRGRGGQSAAQEFAAFLGDYIEQRRNDPQDDLITRLIVAEEDGEKLSRDELIATCILLLNAGHEATVHSLGQRDQNGSATGFPTR